MFEEQPLVFEVLVLYLNKYPSILHVLSHLRHAADLVLGRLRGAEWPLDGRK
jgi:hypothetical protein